MFELYFDKFDILCLQETFGLFTSELKEIIVTYGQKAGFLYHAPVDLDRPLNHSLFIADSGLTIMSRFPIVEHDFQQFSLGVFDDGESQCGTLYAKIEITQGKFVQVFNSHLMCTNYNYSAEFLALSRQIRDNSIKELSDFMMTKV